MSESLRRFAVALSGRHWLLWSWRRARGAPRKTEGVSFEAIMRVRMRVRVRVRDVEAGAEVALSLR
jgi:hypothetical protein